MITLDRRGYSAETHASRFLEISNSAHCGRLQHCSAAVYNENQELGY
jgi:hypothetical protein